MITQDRPPIPTTCLWYRHKAHDHSCKSNSLTWVFLQNVTESNETLFSDFLYFLIKKSDYNIKYSEKFRNYFHPPLVFDWGASFFTEFLLLKNNFKNYQSKHLCSWLLKPLKSSERGDDRTDSISGVCDV